MPTQDPGHRPFGHVGEPGDLRRVPAGFLPGGQDPATGFGTGPGRAGTRTVRALTAQPREILPGLGPVPDLSHAGTS